MIQLGLISQNDLQIIRSRVGRCTAFFECPKCQAPDSSDCKNFQYEDLDQKHQCMMCGKRTPVKDWKCECKIIWHTCRIHRYARANDTRKTKQSQATNGQSAPAANPEAKRVKVRRQNSDLETNAADDNRNGSNKRKREGDQSEQTDDEAIVPYEDNINLKRKRDHEPESLINLGNTVHKRLNPNLLGPTLTNRFMASSPMG